METVGPPDPGMADEAALAAFVAAGHDPDVDRNLGRVSFATSWTEDGRDGRTTLGREHVGPMCTACGFRFCEACDGTDRIPSCDGVVGLSRRLRESADALGRAWQRAHMAATKAERRARGEAQWTDEEVAAQAELFENLWRQV